jgi:type IV pilus assembly protein PilY1
MTALSVRRLAVLWLVCLPLAAGATDIRFEQGSLIIPMQRAYQTECGAVAAYGLVYRLLQHGVTVHWIINPAKSSHHRCKVNPTDPKYSRTDFPRYNDGCDMEVSKASGKPVSLLINTTGAPQPNFLTYATADAPNSTGSAAFTVDDSVTTVRYMGAPFVIDASQKARALDLLKTHADFEKFRGPEGAPDCKPKTTADQRYYVRIHEAHNAFVAPVARIINEIPPPIALAKGYNEFSSTAGSVKILEEYLERAGLMFTGAKGTFDSHGLIFDVLTEEDMATQPGYPKGKLNAPHPTKPNKTYYNVMWAPHWDLERDMFLNIIPASLARIQAALPNIAHFVDQGNSIFNECSSIMLYEDAYWPNDSAAQAISGNETTQFMSENGLQGVVPTPFTPFSMADFAKDQKGQDCSDPGRAGDCYTYTNYADLFSQKGDYELLSTSGLLEAIRPRPGKQYKEGTFRMLTTTSSDASKNGWDIYTTRLKDNNRQKGTIIYVTGHSFSERAAGSRIVLNTLLNLAYRPDTTETSRSEPVADVVYKPDGTLDKVNILSATFLNTPPPSAFPERLNFDKAKPADWVFPYIEGRFRSIPSDKIGTTLQHYSKDADWDASTRLPAPGDRRIFTVLGSNQTGLKKLDFKLSQLTVGCQDHASTGKIAAVCDLQEALGLDLTGAGVSELDLDQDGTVDAAKAAEVVPRNDMAQHFLQRVRGYCVAHITSDSTPLHTMTPVVTDCDNREFGEVRSRLGGLDHASPAVVGPSPYLRAERPTVAYIGGLDGQLHAIYLRGTQAGFAPPLPGTELWAFLPKGQLGRLLTNNARVDVSPVVADVFVDYEDKNGNGVLDAGTESDADPDNDERNTQNFRWRTVLVSGSGRLGGEVFALDVTDPVNPIILWDVTAASDNADPADAALKTAFKWSDREGVAPNYNRLDLAAKTGPYNFADLGDALEINLVPVRRGNIPSFQLIVSTNGASVGAQQLQVFALDAGTGRKLWQWERPYDAGTSNSVPAGTSTLDVDGDGSMDRVYVGDMEGRLWELSIHTGANFNYIQDESNGYDSYPLFITESPAYHPISTAPAIMRLPYSLAGPFASLAPGSGGKLALVFGTAGNDWVLSKLPTVKGRVYVVAALPEDKNIRHHLTYDKVNKATLSVAGTMNSNGTAKRSGGSLYHELAEKERAVGAPQIVGSKIVLTTAYGTTESDFFSSNMQGSTHVLDLGTAGGARMVADSGKAAAGGLVLPDGSLITQSMTGIQKVSASSAVGTVPKTGLTGKRTRARVGAWMDLGRSLAE